MRRQTAIRDTFPIGSAGLEHYWERRAAVVGLSNSDIEYMVKEQTSELLEYWFKHGHSRYLHPWVPAAEQVARVVVGLMTTSEIERQLNNEAAKLSKLLERLENQKALRESIESAVRLCDEWRPGVFDFRLQMDGHFVYALYERTERGENLNYIGETQNLFARLARHRSQKVIPFGEFAVIQCSSDSQRLKLEKDLIKQFDPPYNKKHAGRGYGKAAA